MADPKSQLPAQLQEQLQQQLRDLQMPADVSWWPLAFGWWIVIAVALIGLTTLLLKLRQKHRQNQYRKFATRELAHTFVVWQEDQNTASYLQSANSILKRCIVYLESTTSTTSRSSSSLTGQRWLKVLNEFNKTPLSTDCQHALGQLAYTAKPGCDVALINDELLAWLKLHQANPPQDEPAAAAQAEGHHA